MHSSYLIISHHISAFLLVLKNTLLVTVPFVGLDMIFPSLGWLPCPQNEYNTFVVLQPPLPKIMIYSDILSISQYHKYRSYLSCFEGLLFASIPSYDPMACLTFPNWCSLPRIPRPKNQCLSRWQPNFLEMRTARGQRANSLKKNSVARRWSEWPETMIRWSPHSKTIV